MINSLNLYIKILFYWIISFLIINACQTSYAQNFQKVLGGNNNDEPMTLIHTSDGGCIIAGYTKSFGAGDKDIYVIKLDANYNTVWSKAIGGSQDDIAYSVVQSTDGDIMIAASTASYGAGNNDICIIKIDTMGNILWTKTYGKNGNDFPYKIIQTYDGNFIIDSYSTSFGAGLMDIYLIKIDSDGNLIWNKTIGGNENDWLDNIVLTSDSGFIGIGSTKSFGAGGGQHDIYAIKFDSTGNIEWQKTYGNTKNEGSYGVCEMSNKDFIISGHTMPTYNSINERDLLIFRINSQGDIIWSKKYIGTNYDESARNVLPCDNGDIISIGYTESFGSGVRDIFLLKIQGDGTFLRMKTFGGTDYEDISFNSSILANNDEIIISGSTKSFDFDGSAADYYNIYLIKTDTGILSSDCNSTMAILSVSNYAMTTTSPAPTISTQSPTINSANNSAVVVTDIAYICCLQISLGNDTSICYGDSLLLDASTEGVTYLWQDSSTDSVFSVSSSGVYWVEVTDTNGCVKRDSIQVNVIPYPIADIGNDTNLCNSAILIDAGSGCTSYLWQDGSTNQTCFTDSSGIYWVELANSIGCSLRDSVNINIYSLPVIDIGTDTIICSGSSCSIDAGSGFISYLWQDGSTDQTFNADTEGIYWVEIIDTNNCFNKDSIQIDLITVPSIYIGNDTVLCNSILNISAYNVNNEYVSYLWQDNTNDSLFTVSSTGLYWVQASNVCGSDTDSVYVYIAPLPQVNLGNDTSICEGTNIILKAGTDYKSYLWQDSSTDSLLSVNSAGIYYVYVTDTNNCVNTDNIGITIIPLPYTNLGNDTTICKSSKILDAGAGYDSYLWQDGNTYQSIIVSDSGTYCVRVSNICGIDRDTIIIYGCSSTYIYVPNIFTPNEDAINDIFLVKGLNAKTFEIYVFNRWGNMVYYSCDINQGWNGLFMNHGAKCMQGVYAWVIKFRDTEDNLKTKYGHVSLLR